VQPTGSTDDGEGPEADRNFIFNNLYSTLLHPRFPWKDLCPHSLDCVFNGKNVTFSYDHASKEFRAELTGGVKICFAQDHAVESIAALIHECWNRHGSVART